MKFVEAENGPNDVICWHIVFTLYNADYALHVENNAVTAMRVGYKFDFVPCIALTVYLRSANFTDVRGMRAL